MLKSKARVIALTFIIFVISVLAISSKNYANNLNSNNKGITNWKVAVTCDAKEIQDTHKISFKIQDNPNVAPGKIAPGSKAIATIEFDLKDTNVPVEILATVDDSEIFKPLTLSATLDDEEYDLGTSAVVENGKKVLTLELEWKDSPENDELDTALGIIAGKISVPVTINVKQHV